MFYKYKVFTKVVIDIGKPFYLLQTQEFLDSVITMLIKKIVYDIIQHCFFNFIILSNFFENLFIL